jgi:hypothetical protein
MMPQRNALFHGSCSRVQCSCLMWNEIDTQDSSNSDIDCRCSDRYCELYKLYDNDSIDVTSCKLPPLAYVERNLVADVYSILSNINNDRHYHTDNEEWSIRLLRWILAPVCKIQAPEICFISNIDVHALDIFNSSETFNPKELIPYFRLHF